MTAGLSVALPIAVDEPAATRVGTRAHALICREVEVLVPVAQLPAALGPWARPVVVPGPAGAGPGAAAAGPAGLARQRNALVEAARQSLVVLLQPDDPLESTFLDRAVSALDEDQDLGFVTAWLDGLPERADHLRLPPCDVTALLGRPWFVHIPTVFRRQLWHDLGGFDETLGAGEDVDLWLRALGRGLRGAVVEDALSRPRPWGDVEPPFSGEGVAAAMRPLFERYRDLFDRHAEAVVLQKERVLQQLLEQARAINRRRAQLTAEFETVTAEAARLDRLLGATGPGQRPVSAR